MSVELAARALRAAEYRCDEHQRACELCLDLRPCAEFHRLAWLCETEARRLRWERSRHPEQSL